MLHRHDLLFLDKTGREYAAEQVEDCLLDHDAAHRLILSGVPAIVRRQEQIRKDIVEVGFSGNVNTDGIRLKATSIVPVTCIEKILTPFDLTHSIDWESKFTYKHVLKELITAGERCGLSVGVYGSLALEIVLRRQYCTSRSDIDLFVKKDRPEADVKAFYNKVIALERRCSVIVDVEISCEDCFAAKLKELFSTQVMVLCKGYSGVELRSKETFVTSR